MGLKDKVINDPIHGYIELEDYCMRVIDTVPFQRLRSLRQLGSAYFVFPGASHSRFEHSIGVCYLSGLLVEHLRTVQPELGITDTDVKCVKLAGLCHDLGHGPFSHVFDNEIVPRLIPGTKWCHEDASESMLDFIVKEYPDVGISPEELAMIKDLIHGRPRTDYAYAQKRFLFDIVANKRNSIDVDKYDYIQRDCYYVGMKSSIDAVRLIKLTRVTENQICFDQKEAFSLYDLFHIRYSLFKRVYSHRVGKAIEYMLTDIFVLANPMFRFENMINDMNRYQYLTDGVLNEIEHSTVPELEEARKLIYRLRRRDLYALVNGMIISKKHLEYLRYRITPKTLYEECAKLMFSESSSRRSSTNGVESGFGASEDVATLDDSRVKEKEIIIEFLHLGYAMKDRNPMDNVRFYNKKTSYMHSRKTRRVKSPVRVVGDDSLYGDDDEVQSSQELMYSPTRAMSEDRPYGLINGRESHRADGSDPDTVPATQESVGSRDGGSKRRRTTPFVGGSPRSSFQLKKEQVSGLIPNVFEEVSLRVFVKRRAAIEEVYRGFQVLVQYLNEDLYKRTGEKHALEIADFFAG